MPSPRGCKKNAPPSGSKSNPAQVTADASSLTTFHEGTAYFPDAHVTFTGADAPMHGLFNLLDTRSTFTGNADLQRDISHAATGLKSALLKPLSPLFRHKGAGAVVSVAVTGTARPPKIEQEVLA